MEVCTENNVFKTLSMRRALKEQAKAEGEASKLYASDGAKGRRYRKQ